jgi:hypothetical protein
MAMEKKTHPVPGRPAPASRDIDGYPERYLAYFARQGERVHVSNDAIYRVYSNMVVPFGPADVDYSLSPSAAAQALRELGGILVRTTRGFRPEDYGAEWYAVVCTEFTRVADIASPNIRSKLRRGLRNCEVRRLTAEELARRGYDVFMSAQRRYGGAPLLGPEAFRQRILCARGFEDIVHFWGVFCDGALAGYSTTYRFGTREVSYSTIRFDPSFFKRYVSYALFYRMNEHYLVECGVSYVNNGFRSILHDTQVQPFVEHTFKFHKAPTTLDVVYRAPYGAFVRATFPMRGLVGRVDHRLRALYELERVVRAQRSGR